MSTPFEVDLLVYISNDTADSTISHALNPANPLIIELCFNDLTRINFNSPLAFSPRAAVHLVDTCRAVFDETLPIFPFVLAAHRLLRGSGGSHSLTF